MSAKRRLKSVVTKSIGHWLAHVTVRGIAVLCYHSVHSEKSFRSATPAMFEQHLQWISQNCRVVRFSKMFDALSIQESTAPVVAITFDDGFSDNYEYAFPLLQEYAIPATFFVTAGFIEQQCDVVERIRLLNAQGYEKVTPVTWPQLLEMRRAGMEIGSHTFGHPNLARLTRALVEGELRRSKEIIEQRLGEAITMMAYPFGKARRHFGAETTRIAAESGYEYAASVVCKRLQPGCSRFNIPRFVVANDSVDTLKDKINGAWDVIGVWQENIPAWVARVISPKEFEF